MSYHYGVPPPHYSKFYDPESPYNSGDYVHYAAYDGTTATPKRGHTRRPSFNPTPKAGGYYSPAGSPPPWYGQDYATPRKQVYVSTRDGKERRYETYSYPNTKYHVRSKSSSKPTQPVHVYDGAGYAERVIYRSPSTKQNRSGKAPADDYVYHTQEQVYSESPRRSRTTRRPSTSKPTHKSKPSYSSPAVATAEDAARAKIPAGYSIKNWDPTELPIILLGSVFDANSLGKWIYDWTVYRYTASHPFADVAGEIWLLLIKLAGKMKRGEECLPRVRSTESRELMRDFLDSAYRLWDKFKNLLKDSEYYMLKAAKREGNKKMGKNAGTEFVDSIFGRDRFLGDTEKLMQSIRTWNHRFDANCEDIIRRPSAA